MNPVLARWNALDTEAAAREVLPCCGSRAWAMALAARRPISNETLLLETASSVWLGLYEKDWQEAFDSHPRIGQRKAVRATEQALRWSAQEQIKAAVIDDAAKIALEDANRRYEERFGRIFIVCATNKTSAEILRILDS